MHFRSLGRRALALRLAAGLVVGGALPMLCGCNGTYSGITSQGIVPIQGTFSGTWNLDSINPESSGIIDQNGTTEVVFDPNGAVTGSFYNATFNLTNALSGVQASNGVVSGTFKVGAITYAVSGPFNEASNGNLSGSVTIQRVSGSSTVTIGTLSFNLRPGSLQRT